MKQIIYIILLLVVFENSYSQNIDTSKVKWLNFETALKKFTEKQKPILIFFDNPDVDSSTFMLNKTFGNNEVSSYINILFYSIKINTYTKDSITFFDGIVYKNTGKYGKYHDIIAKLGALDVGFPSMLLFTKNAKGTLFNKYKDRDHIFPILIYYAEEVYNSNTSYNDFEKYYFKTYPPGKKQIITRVNVKWNTFEEVEELNKKTPKKILINLYDNYSMSSTMMRLSTFNNKNIATYLENNFYCINLNVKSEKEINFQDKKFINEKLPHKYHQLAISLLNANMKFPAFVIYDENYKFLFKIQQYMIPKDIEPLLHYVGDNVYKTKTQTEYMKTFKSKFIND